MNASPILLNNETIAQILEDYENGPVYTFSYSLKDAYEHLAMIDAVRYGKTRNYLDGKVTHLSPYISTGILSLSEILSVVLKKHSYENAQKLISELM
jgi:deoxyribodipyrimidine photo-lyase